MWMGLRPPPAQKKQAFRSDIQSEYDGAGGRKVIPQHRRDPILRFIDLCKGVNNLSTLALILLTQNFTVLSLRVWMFLT